MKATISERSLTFSLRSPEEGDESEEEDTYEDSKAELGAPAPVHVYMYIQSLRAFRRAKLVPRAWYMSYSCFVYTLQVE